MDPTDLRVVESLDKNARESFSKIASGLSIPSRTVQRRVARMVDNGFIRSFEVIVDPSRLELSEAVCDIQIQSSVKNDTVRNRLLEISGITEILTLAGGTFVAYLYYRNSPELGDILRQIGATPGVANVQYEVAPKSDYTRDHLSQTSWKIIQSLNHHARKEFAEVAQETGLSSRTVQRHLRWLTNLNIVKFGVDVDVSKATDLFVYVLLIRLQLGAAKVKILKRVRQSVQTVWREMRTVNPFAIILSLYAQSPTDLERDVEQVRLVPGIEGVRIMIVTADRRSTSFLDGRIAGMMKPRTIS